MPYKSAAHFALDLATFIGAFAALAALAHVAR